MKTTLIILGCTVLFIVGVPLANMLSGKSVPSSDKHLTKYQECVATSEHMRSEEDRLSWTHNICNHLEYEPGDFR